MKELDFLKKTLVSAYEEFGTREVLVSEKAAFDVVTNIDKGIEQYFARELEREFSGDVLLGEEFSSNSKLSGRTWILDPIDGTYNFSIGSPLFGLQAAFWADGEVRASVLYLPRLHELYEAELGCGAFCNGKRLSVSDRSVKESIVSFGDLSHDRPRDARDEGEMMKRAYAAIARLRMYGAACVDFAHLASGKTEGTVLYTRNKWDIAPGMLLAKEAGAQLFGVEGEEYSFSSRGIFACNRRELFDALKNNG